MDFMVPHPQYVRHEKIWRLTKAVLEGKQAVLEMAEDILPKSEAHKLNADMYRNYCLRASWFGASAKTLDAWSGVIFRKPVSVIVPPIYQWRLNNIDNQWGTFDAVARRVVREILAYARVGILVDANNRGLSNKEHGLPYLVVYSADQILNWSEINTDTGVAPRQVILQETMDEPHSSGIGVQHLPAYRILELDSEGFYRVRTFSLKDGRVAEHPTVYPTIGGRKLDHIPFYVGGPEGLGFNVQKAPLLDVVNANVNHFQTSALLANSLYWSASPTALITGLSPDDKGPYPVGDGVLWRLPTGATAGYVEFSGPGINAMLQELTRQEHKLALMGTSALSEQKREVETAEALTIRTAGESASLITVIDSASLLLTKALTEACWWGVAVGDVSVTINRDLVNDRITPDEIRAYVYAYQNNTITLDTLLNLYSQKEILPPGVLISDEKTALLAQAITQPPILLPISEAQQAARASQTATRRSQNSLNGTGRNMRQLPTDSTTSTKDANK